VNIANFDYEVDPLDAQRALPQICLDGNIKPLAFVEATPDVVADEASKLMNLFAARGGFIMSSGCEIPPESRPENIAAMVAAARKRI
jgi:uroporphyrinogen decarboxylase